MDAGKRKQIKQVIVCDGYKNTRNGCIYLPEYFSNRIAKSFHLEHDKDILLWDFSVEISETVKIQIEFLLRHITKNIQNNEERRNRYLLPLKYLFQYVKGAKITDILLMEKIQEQEYSMLLKAQTGKLCGSAGRFVDFCRRELFIVSKEPAWYANVWYVDGLHIRAERQSESSVIQSFSFLEITIKGNRNAFQMYLKYLFSITGQSVATIRIQHTYVREFLRYLEEKHMVVSEIDITILEKYFEYLMVQKLKAQSYNNKLCEITNFIGYLQAKELIPYFEIPMGYFLKKAYPSKNEIRGLDKKLRLLEENLHLFPEDLRIMSVILMYTGIAKGKLFLLKGLDFCWDKETSWMNIPETERRVPIPDTIHWLIIRYMKRQQKEIDEYLFLNSKGKRYTTAGFRSSLMKQCSLRGILDGEYVFKGYGYQKEFCKALYRNGISIQAIREYMGYATDERVKEHVGWVDQRIQKASEQYFEKEKHNLGGAILMAKYDKMNEINCRKSRQKVELAIREIKSIQEEGRHVSVSDLAKRTGLSKGFFYKNEEVRVVLDASKQKEKAAQVDVIRKEIAQHSIEVQNELYQKELEKLRKENEELKKENQKLAKLLERVRL